MGKGRQAAKKKAEVVKPAVKVGSSDPFKRAAEAELATMSKKTRQKIEQRAHTAAKVNRAEATEEKNRSDIDELTKLKTELSELRRKVAKMNHKLPKNRQPLERSKKQMECLKKKIERLNKSAPQPMVEDATAA